MRRYHGKLVSSGGKVTRTGAEMAAYVESDQGQVDVYVWHNSQTGRDMAEIALTPNADNIGVYHVLYRGPIAPKEG